MKIRTLKFNFLMNMLLTVSNFLFPLLTFPYVSRVLTPMGTGKVAFASSLVSYFSIVAAFGIADYGVRAVAQVRDNKEKLSKVIHELFLINLFLMLFVLFLYFLCIYFVPSLREEKTLFFISGLNIVFTILSVEWVYKGTEQYFYIAIRSLFFKFIAFFLIFYYVRDYSDYTIYAFIIIFATVGSGVVNLYNLKNVIIVKVFKNYEFYKHVKSMAIFFIISIAVAIYVNFSSVLLGFFYGAEDVGYYNAAYRIKDVMQSIITSLGAVLLPRLSYFIKNNMHDEFNSVLIKSMNFIFIISLPMVIFCILYAEPSVLLFAGNGYYEAILPLKILSIIILIASISNLTGIQMLIPLNKDKELCYSVIYGAISSFIFSPILVYYYGVLGAVVSVLISQVIVMTSQIIALRNYFYMLFSNIEYIKLSCGIIISILISFSLTWFAEGGQVLIFLMKTILFFSCYFLTLLLLRERFILLMFSQIKSKFY